MFFAGKRSRPDANELEIVYEVQWKTPGNDNDKAKIIGILDSPDTNLDWTTFKSYLIQNSGNMHLATDDIKISYVDSDDDLIPVDSEMEFRECLKFSRVRARHGRKVVMKVSMGSNGGGARPKEFTKNSEEQLSKPKLIKLNYLKKKQQKEIPEKIEWRSPLKFNKQAERENDNSEVPKWFENYMTNFKTEIVKEITESVVQNLQRANGPFGHQGHTRRLIPNPSPVTVPRHQMHHMFEKTCRKKKKKISEEDSSDCTDGLHKEWEEKIDILKQMQKLSKREKHFEKKFDAKLEKLETKTKKMIEKKPFLLFGDTINKFGNAGVRDSSSKRSSRFQQSPSAPVVDSIMDALPVEEYTYTPHVSKGEIVTQTWNVMNNGNLPWTDETELRFAWGSKSLVPLMTSVKCPLLQPGEIGKVKVKLQAPVFAGNFESYWHFHHVGRRFGHWLGCSVIVDEDLQWIKIDENLIQDHLNQEEPLSSTPPRLQQIDTPVDLTMKCSKIDAVIMDDANKKTFTPVFEFNPVLNSTPEPSDSSAFYTILPGTNKKEQENELNQKDNILVPIGDLLNIKEATEETEKEQKIENVTQGIANMTIYGVPDEWKDSEVPVDLDETKATEDKEEYCSDSDNISVISGTGSVDSDATEPSEEFVVIPMPQCFNCEQGLSENVPVTQPISVEIPKSSSEESVQIHESDNNNNMELKPYPEIPICIPVLMTPDGAGQDEPSQINETRQESEVQKIPEPEPITDDEDPNNVYVKDAFGRSIPVAKVMSQQQTQAAGSFAWNCSKSHNTFGDPNIGHGPNGPRFPCGATYFYDSNVPQCHNPGASTNFRPQHEIPKIPPMKKNSQFCGHPCNAENNSFKRSECHCTNFQHPIDYQNLQHEYTCTFNLRNKRESPQKTGPSKKTSQTQQTSQSSSSSSSSSWSHAQQNIHTEQPRPYKYAYVFEVEPKKQNKSSSNSTSSRRSTKTESREQSPVAAAVQILPETLVTGAVNVASSAINTARSVIDMLIPRHDDVVTGHWEHVPPAVEESLRTLSEMGFNNRELNIMLLNQHDNDVARVISELIQ